MNDIKVKDIHHPGVTEEFDRLTLKDLENLLKKKEQFVDTGCPACHNITVHEEFVHQGLDYKRCPNCELLYISPAPTEEMHLDYVVNSTAMAYWREVANPSMKTSRRPIYSERMEYAKGIFDKIGFKPKTSLEIGAGNGEFAEELYNTTDLEKIVVLEPQELALDIPNLETIKGGFDQLESVDRTFDVVFAWELIEHLLEPDMFLKLLRKVIEPNGLLILSTPNENSLETRKLCSDSSNILFDHVRLYNPKAISELLTRNGFKIIELSTPGVLDTERLQQYLSSNPEKFSDDPALRYILSSGQEINKDFQKYLQDNQLSSHMRVVAIPDGSWNGSETPRIGNDNAQKTTNSLKQPTNFNKVVLPATQDDNNPYPKMFMSHILHDIVKVNSGRFVDLGGGWGRHAEIVSHMGYDVVSVDREEATADVPSVVCDFVAEPLPFEDNSVDIVFSKSVIEHFQVKDLTNIMREVRRVLRPGGVFIVTTPDWEFNVKEFYQVFTHTTPYTKSSLKQCLTMYDFERVTTQNVIQLPETWHNPFLKKISDITASLPLPRSLNNWVRWSKERVLMGICYKPEA